MFNDIFYTNPTLTEVSSNVLRCKFLTPEGCLMIQETCKAIGGWTAEFGDSLYKTHDIHFEDKLPDFFQIIKDHFHSEVVPLCAEYWSIPYFEITTVFAIKYSDDTQKELKLHHDDSYISGSVKLNNTYSGAELYFPRQNFSNKEEEIGDILLWPGDITHRHGCTQLLEGEKHSLTLWTKKLEES